MNKCFIIISLFALACKTAKVSTVKSNNHSYQDSIKHKLAIDSLRKTITVGGDRTPPCRYLINDSLLLIGNNNGIPIYDTIRKADKIK